MSRLEDQLWNQIKLARLPEPEREFKAVKDRRYRWDFAWPNAGMCGLLVEVQGGTWIKGSHSTGKGIARDTEKLNTATLDGWQSLQFTSDQIRSGLALKTLQAFFAGQS